MYVPGSGHFDTLAQFRRDTETQHKALAAAPQITHSFTWLGAGWSVEASVTAHAHAHAHARHTSTAVLASEDKRGSRCCCLGAR
jgi:hypothetical protein